MPIGTGGAQPQGGSGGGVVPPSGNQQTLVYRPGGPGGDGSYATWAALYTAFGLTTPGEVTVFIDDSFVTPAVVPTGTRDWGYRARFMGYKPGASMSFGSDLHRVQDPSGQYQRNARGRRCRSRHREALTHEV